MSTETDQREANISGLTCEIQTDDEADIREHYQNCKKKSAHKDFIPVQDFNLNHLPSSYRDEDLINLIKTSAKLTVRINMDKRISGTGRIVRVIKNEESGRSCPCQRCRGSNSPSNVWGKVEIETAAHVIQCQQSCPVQNITCRLFFDKKSSPLVNVYGVEAVIGNSAEDFVSLRCVTCDAGLLFDLEESVQDFWDLFVRVTKKFKTLGDQVRLTIIVSHPHGCPKMISLGEWTGKEEVKDGWITYSRFRYTASTCPGSSGAHVFILGAGGVMHLQHIHSGVDCNGENYCTFGRDYM